MDVCSAACGCINRLRRRLQPEAAQAAGTAPATPEARPVRRRQPITARRSWRSATACPPALAWSAGQSFPDVVQRLIDADGYKYQVVNMGVSGDTTTDGVERLPNVLALKPAIVIAGVRRQRRSARSARSRPPKRIWRR